MTNFPLKPHFCDELLLAFSLNRIIRDVMNNVTKQCDEFNSPRCFITFGNCCGSVTSNPWILWNPRIRWQNPWNYGIRGFPCVVLIESMDSSNPWIPYH